MNIANQFLVEIDPLPNTMINYLILEINSGVCVVKSTRYSIILKMISLFVLALCLVASTGKFYTSFEICANLFQKHFQTLNDFAGSDLHNILTAVTCKNIQLHYCLLYSSRCGSTRLFKLPVREWHWFCS